MSTTGPDEPVSDPLAAVAAWRARAAASVDPVRLCIVEALARRAAAQQGEARGLLARRVEDLLAAWGTSAPAGEPAPPQGAGVLDALSALVDRLGRSAEPPVLVPAPHGTARRADAPRPASRSLTAPQHELRAVVAFKGTRSRLRAEQRLRLALAQVPAKAGPLNSSNVVHRALQAMHDLSPAYLDAWMSHIDTLLWLEQVTSGAESAPRPAARAEDPRRRGARPARKT